MPPYRFLFRVLAHRQHTNVPFGRLQQLILDRGRASLPSVMEHVALELV